MSSGHLATVIVVGITLVAMIVAVAFAARARISANQARIAEAETRRVELEVIERKTQADREGQ